MISVGQHLVTGMGIHALLCYYGDAFHLVLYRNREAACRKLLFSQARQMVVESKKLAKRKMNGWPISRLTPCFFVLF